MLVPGDLVVLTQTIGMIDGPVPGGPVIAVGPGRPGRPPKYVLEAGAELRVRTFPRDEGVSAVAEGVSKNLIMGVPVSVLRLVKEAPERDAVIAAERAERERLATAAAVVVKRKKPRPTRPIPKDCTVCWVRDARKLARYGFDREGAEAAGEQLFDEVGIHTADDERVEFVAICGLSVVGAITFAERDGEPTLSVAIDPDWQKRNLGRRLAEALLAKHEGNYYVQVINPNMAKILEDLGFEAESRSGWSRESPMMKR